jgi:uncharacterized membrane protein required for colicin V production
VLIDAACLVLVLLFALGGWRRGFWLSLLSLGGLIAAYLAAYFFSQPAGRALAGPLRLQPLLAYPLAGGLIFVLMLLLVSGIRRILIRTRRTTRDRPRAWRIADHLGGAGIGAAYATVLVLLLTWLLLALQAITPLEAMDLKGSQMARWASPLAEKVARAAAQQASGSESMASAVAGLAKDPGRTTRGYLGLLQNERLQSMLQDPQAINALASGDLRALKKNASLRALAKDPGFIAAVHQAGLLAEASEDLSPEDASRLLVSRLAPLARVMTTLAQDPEVQHLLQDPTLADRLQRRELISLANDAAFNRLAEIVLQTLRQPEPPGSAVTSESRNSEPTKEASRKEEAARADPPALPRNGGAHIYRWTDRKGVVHFSDQPPRGGISFHVVDAESRGKKR